VETARNRQGNRSLWGDLGLWLQYKCEVVRWRAWLSASVTGRVRRSSSWSETHENSRQGSITPYHPLQFGRAIWHTLRGGRFTRPKQGKRLFCLLGLQLSVQDGPGNQASRARRRRPNNKLSGVEVRGGAQPPEPVGGAWGHRADSPTSGRYGNRPVVLRNVSLLGNTPYCVCNVWSDRSQRKPLHNQIPLFNDGRVAGA